MLHVCPGYSFINAIWWIICVSLRKLFRELKLSACLYPIRNTSIPHHKHNYHWLFIIESSHVFLLSLWHLCNFEKLILKRKKISRLWTLRVGMSCELTLPTFLFSQMRNIISVFENSILFLAWMVWQMANTSLKAITLQGFRFNVTYHTKQTCWLCNK